MNLAPRISRFFVCCLIGLGCFSAGLGQGFFFYPPASPFNGKVVPKTDSTGDYSFFVGGHLYGAHDNSASLYPAASFLGNIRRLDANPVSMLISLGDIMRDGADSMQAAALRQSLSGLRFPVFNTPGNHDLHERKAYEQRFKPTQSCFIYGNDCFLLLDTEYLLEGKPEMITNFIAEQKKRLIFLPNGIKNLFVFSHRLVWAAAEPDFAGADAVSNEPIIGKVDPAHAKAVYDAVLNFRKDTPLYWFAGDVGAKWATPLLYIKAKDPRLHLIATGIGDGRHDALLRVSTNREGKVAISIFPLTAQNWQPLEAHTLTWAQVHVEAQAGGGGLMHLLTRKWLWAAFLIGLLLGGLGTWLYKRRRSQR